MLACYVFNKFPSNMLNNYNTIQSLRIAKSSKVLKIAELEWYNSTCQHVKCTCLPITFNMLICAE